MKREETKRQDGRRIQLATTRWATAAQLALVTSLSSSQNEIQNLEIIDDSNIVNRTKDAVITLQNVLQGKHDSEIDDTLNQYQVPPDRWWSSLYKVVEGIVSLHF